MAQAYLKIEEPVGTGATTPAADESTGDDELENESIEELLEERLSEAEAELKKTLDRNDRLETLVEALGVPPGFVLEFLLSSVCPHHALQAVGLAAGRRGH